MDGMSPANMVSFWPCLWWRCQRVRRHGLAGVMMHVSVSPNGWLQHSYRIVWRLSWLDESSDGVDMVFACWPDKRLGQTLV